jgi:hypothetical protein
VTSEGGSLSTKLLSQHTAEDGMVLPINILLGDSCGDAARLVVRAGEQPEVQLLN